MFWDDNLGLIWINCSLKNKEGEMECPKDDCSGTIDTRANFFVRSVEKTGYVCCVCSRLYLLSGAPLVDDEGNQGFREGGKNIFKDEGGNIVP
jgi:hypothetical protein